MPTYLPILFFTCFSFLATSKMVLISFIFESPITTEVLVIWYIQIKYSLEFNIKFFNILLNILLLLQKQWQLFYLFVSESIIGSLFKIMFGKYKYHYFFWCAEYKKYLFLHSENLLFALTFTNTWQHWIASISRFVFRLYMKNSFFWYLVFKWLLR